MERRHGGNGVPARRQADRVASRGHPDALSIEVRTDAGERRWSYRELDGAASRWSRRLGELGVGPESRVGACLPASPVLPAVLLGVLRAGGVGVPLDPASSAFQWRIVIEDTDPAVILADAASAALLDHTRSRVLDPAVHLRRPSHRR